MFGIKMTKKFLSFNLRCYVFGDFATKCVKECSRKDYNKQRRNLTITVTDAIATTKQFGPLEGNFSESHTSKNSRSEKEKNT